MRQMAGAEEAPGMLAGIGGPQTAPEAEPGTAQATSEMLPNVEAAGMPQVSAPKIP